MKTVKNILAAVIVALSFTMVSCEKEDSGRPGDNDVCIIGQTFKLDSVKITNVTTGDVDSFITYTHMNVLYKFGEDSIVATNNNDTISIILETFLALGKLVDCEKKEISGANPNTGGDTNIEYVLNGDNLIIHNILKYDIPGVEQKGYFTKQ